ncbi:ATP-binding protein [Sphingobium phenoxybenzoativorans]|uniref:ATP-binding protein n=1 Tax=Sphingobium phenoxybenzoativorans TaxID=1592790 RepID=UPI003CCEA961
MNHGGAASRVDNIRRSLVHLKNATRPGDARRHPARHRAGQNRWHRAIDILLNEETVAPGEPQDQGGPAHGKVPIIKTLDGYDFSFQPSLDRKPHPGARWPGLHQTGPRWCICWVLPVPGKSHIATALAVEAVKAGKSVYFIPLADLIASLTKAEREGTLRERIRFLCRSSLLVVDEIGYLPSRPGAAISSSSSSTPDMKRVP